MSLVKWHKDFTKLSGVDLYLISEHINKFEKKPLLTLLTPVYNTKEVKFKEAYESKVFVCD